MANTGDFASGTSAFIRGFSFVDDINQRKIAQQKLDARLEEQRKDREIQRQIQTQQLAERGQDRANSLIDRQRGLKNEQRQREANALLADPNADPAALQEYADLPGVSAILRQQGIDVRDQADLEVLQGGGGLRQQVTGGATQSQATEQPGGGGLSSQVKAALLPGGIGATPSPLTSAELGQLAELEGPAAAMKARDDRNAILAANGPQPGDELPVGGGSGPLGIQTAGAKRRAAEMKKNRQKMDQVNSDWDAFVDIENQGGDGLRNLNANILTSKYFQERNSISDPELRQVADARMKPAITETINTQQEIIINAEPTSLEARNARRKLAGAYGLANEIGVSYSPLVAAQVDDRGLPIGGANQTLTNSVVEQGREGPIASLPLNPDMTRADVTMLNRGVSGNRVNNRFATAAFRQYKAGRINFAQYDSLMRTGALPVEAPTIVQTDPKKDTWIVNPNGTRKILERARDPEDDPRGRNIFTKEGLAHIRLASESLDTEDDPHRGFGITNTFFSWAGDNEQKLTNMGYDFKNLADQASMWNLFSNAYVIRDQLNDEVFFQGDFMPDFEERYGDVDDAIFNPRFQKDFGGDDGRANRESITDFTGENPVNDQRLKQQRQIGNPQTYEEIRQQYPQLRGVSDEEIEAELQRLSQAR